MISRRIVLALLCWLATAGVSAAAVITSPDDVCLPSDDPCLIATSLEVDAANTLDFGLRTVRVVSGGGFVGTLDLQCGAFEVALSPTVRWMKVETPAGVARATVTARRACSGDSATPCLNDLVCSGLGLGTCSVGDGGVRITGYISGATADIEIRGAGDIAIDGEILAQGKRGSADGGDIWVESSQGSVDLASEVDVSGGPGGDYGGTGLGGAVRLRAASDVIVRDRIDAKGGGALVEFDADADVFVTAAVLVQGVPGNYLDGGTVDMFAQANLDVVDLPGHGATQININGGSARSSYYGVVYAAPGGYGFFRAGGDVSIGPKVSLRGNSGRTHGPADDRPIAGDWYVEAGGDLYLSAKIQARGRGHYGYGRPVMIEADGAVEITRKTSISTKSMYAGYIQVYGGQGRPMTISGKLDARGGSRVYYGQFYGYGGGINIYGGDLSVEGSIRTGGGAGASGIFVDVCRLSLERGGSINSSMGRQYSSSSYAELTIHESMVAAKGSRIKGKSDSPMTIEYRDPAKPPILDGKARPAPILTPVPLISGCPVCGNGEIDQGETCDDANTTPGDGCDELCQVE